MAFLWEDYLIFVGSILLTLVISLYFGVLRKNKPNTVNEYMFGGGNMPLLPVALSNCASCISSMAFISFPVETYYYGGQMFFICLGEIMAYFLMYYVYLPIFYHLGYISMFEYLEKRFNKFTRCLVSTMFTITQILLITVLVYATSSAIIQATGISFNIFVPVISLGCAVFTAAGGFRGVVWADTCQALFIFLSVIAVIIIGIINIGGLAKVMEISKNGGRLDVFNFDPSPFARHSSWLITLSTVCGTVYRVCLQPGIIQRYKSLADIEKAKRVAIITAIANLIAVFCGIFLGIIIYATYHDCDPVLSESLKDSQQLTSYFVLDSTKTMPGVTGLYHAGLLSATLSTMSTVINSSAVTTYEDLIKPLLPIHLKKKNTNICLKIIALILGIFMTGGVFLVNPNGGIFQFFKTILSFSSCVVIFVFSFGIFFKKANTKGAIVGSIIGVVVSLWFGLGSQSAVAAGKIRYLHKIISIEGCPPNGTDIEDTNEFLMNLTRGSSDYNTPVIFSEDVSYPYRLSFHLITPIGLICSCIIGCIVSYFTYDGKSGDSIDDSLLISRIWKKKISPVNYNNSETGEELKSLNS